MIYEPDKGSNFPTAIKELQEELRWEKESNPRLVVYRVMKFNGTNDNC